MKAQDIRRSYTQFFTERGHRHVPSSPIVPPDDPTLLFTTAGMVQFKPLYTGNQALPYTRATSVQKCLRAGGKGSDLENVGKTLRHHTFFEMLGNFSFGDYFKREALEWAWEFSTQIVKLDPKRIYASVYETDDEAYEIWTRELGVPESNMVRLGTKDNFWGPAGDTGACGPCSELYYDRGEQYGSGLSFQDATINDDDPATRYIEYWNCVFPQFDQQKDGSRPPLKNRGVDTGMGLERLCCIVQNAASPFETDLFLPIVRHVCQLIGLADYATLPIETRQTVNVVADHVRALTFALTEGLLPGNEGRAYVLRRLLRRAARYARHAGMENPFMFNVVDSVVEVMGETYPEIRESVPHIKKVIRTEEEAYSQTLGAGLQRLEALLERADGKLLSGADVFMLSSTYGMPFDDVQEIAAERGLQIDTAEYEVHVAGHREESRRGVKGSQFAGLKEALASVREANGPTKFLGLDHEADGTSPVFETDATILAMFIGEERTPSAKVGDEIIVALDQTPFYAEGGGQVGDSGLLTTNQGATLRVTDTRKTPEDVFLHHAIVEHGTVSEGDAVKAGIDCERRLAIMRNHTATHLLQGALKTVLGKHVAQQGSYVGPDRLRFDFTTPEALSPDQIAEVERLVNLQIMRNATITRQVMGLEEARATGAIAPFGEKYGSSVRVVDVPGWDTEFCGGTHMDATGGIGPFLLVDQSAVSAGVRRLEAVTGENAVLLMRALMRTLKEMSEELSVPQDKVKDRIVELAMELKATRRQMNDLRVQSSTGDAGSLLDKASEVEGIKIVIARLDELDAQQLRQVFDNLKSRCQENLFVTLASALDGKVTLIAGATPDVVNRGVSAGDVVKAIAPILGGSGGGRKEMAQAGGKDPSRLDEALNAVIPAVTKALSK
ncbi:alanine--tRNA ligase [candidate division BRC1 bacterium HGW-BRC1-1]|jgi:alanyl-tRNA synthetase|nr:MAG: alanine--tRNA ligase [candidate division BRC1 bacterium HGW-BRC1-1]